MTDDLDNERPPMSAAEMEAAERLILELRVEGAARDALYAGGCVAVELMAPSVVERLRAQADGRVVAVDVAGRVRYGRAGPMTASELVAELRVTRPYNVCF